MYIGYMTFAGFSGLFLILLVISLGLFVYYHKAKYELFNVLENDRKIIEFFSNITHELKIPISIILGAIQLIEMKNTNLQNEDSKIYKDHMVIKRNCYRLIRLVNNLLDLARLDSGYLKLNAVNCNIVCLVEEITQSVVPYSRLKDITLIFDTQNEEIITAVDIDKIERIILNLLSNAIKFTVPGGSITVNVDSGDNKVHISVKDTGIGIPKEKQTEIFKRFRQVGNKSLGESEGSGIGLSLVKSFVELHRGDIKIISEQNKGSEFIIDLPLEQVETKEKEEHPTIDYHSKIIEAIKIEFSDIYSIAS